MFFYICVLQKLLMRALSKPLVFVGYRVSAGCTMLLLLWIGTLKLAFLILYSCKGGFIWSFVLNQWMLPLKYPNIYESVSLNLSEIIIYVNCISCSILCVTLYVAREGDYTQRCQTGCSLGNRVFCVTGLSTFDEAWELQNLNTVTQSLTQAQCYVRLH